MLDHIILKKYIHVQLWFKKDLFPVSYKKKERTIFVFIKAEKCMFNEKYHVKNWLKQI